MKGLEAEEPKSYFFQDLKTGNKIGLTKTKHGFGAAHYNYSGIHTPCLSLFTIITDKVYPESDDQAAFTLIRHRSQYV